VQSAVLSAIVTINRIQLLPITVGKMGNKLNSTSYRVTMPYVPLLRQS